MQVLQQRGGGTKHYGVTGEHGGVADVLGDHGFPQAVPAYQNEVAVLGKKVERESALDDLALDLGRPTPLEVGHGLEAFDAAQAETPLQTAAGAIRHFGLRHLLEDLQRGPAGFGSTRQKVI